MSQQYTTRELYGGAITAQLPSDIIDASDLRQIPDHQEVFLSSQTLTSIIFEINEYQTSTSIDENATTFPNGTSSSSSADEAAATYHLNDLIESPDHFSPSGVQTVPAALSQSSLTKYPAYKTNATIISYEIDRFARTALPGSWQTNPAQKEHQVETLQLLIRMKEYGTDLCVRITVPLKELGDSEVTEEARVEKTLAEDVMQRIIESVDVGDFGLFGGAEEEEEE